MPISGSSSRHPLDEFLNNIHDIARQDGEHNNNSRLGIIGTTHTAILPVSKNFDSLKGATSKTTLSTIDPKQFTPDQPDWKACAKRLGLAETATPEDVSEAIKDKVLDHMHQQQGHFYVQGAIGKPGDKDQNCQSFNVTHALVVENDTGEKRPIDDVYRIFTDKRVRATDSNSAGTIQVFIPSDNKFNKIAATANEYKQFQSLLYKIGKKEVYEEMTGQSLHKSATAAFSYNMQPYRLLAPNYDGDMLNTKMIMSNFVKQLGGPERYMKWAQDTIAHLTANRSITARNTNGDPVKLGPLPIKKPLDFIKAVYFDSGKAIVANKVSDILNNGISSDFELRRSTNKAYDPMVEESYPDNPSVPKLPVIMDLIGQFQANPSKINFKNPEHVFAISLMQYHIEGLAVQHDFNLNLQNETYSNRAKATDTGYHGIQALNEAMESKEVAKMLQGVKPVILKQETAYLQLADSVPTFNLLNDNSFQHISGSSKLHPQFDRILWQKLPIVLGDEGFYKATSSKESFTTAATMLGYTKKQVKEQWFAFENCKINHVTVIQDAPHDTDDQAAVAMLMILKLHGKIDKLTLADNAKNVVQAKEFKTNFPRVYLETTPFLMMRLRHEPDFELRTLYPKNGYEMFKYDNGSLYNAKGNFAGLMNFVQKQTHVTQNAMVSRTDTLESWQGKIKPFKVAEDMAKLTLFIGPTSFINAV